MTAKLRTRRERGLGPRPRTLKTRQLVAERAREAEPLFDWALRKGRWGEGAAIQRPKTRGECADIPRPCPFVSCRHHLYLDVKDSGLIRYSFPGVDLDDLQESCSLDAAEQGRRSLEQVGDLVNLTRERVHLVVLEAREKLRPALEGAKDDDDE